MVAIDRSKAVNLAIAVFLLGAVNTVLINYVLIASPVLAQFSQQAEAEQLIQEAERLSNDRQIQQALAKLEQALTIYRGSKNYQSEVIILREMGFLHVALGQYVQAMRRYQEAVEVSKRNSDFINQGYALSDIGWLYVTVSEFSKALDQYQQALIIQEETNDLSGRADTLIKIGDIYSSQGEFQEALEQYQQGVNIYQVLENKLGQAAALSKAADVYRALAENKERNANQGADRFTEAQQDRSRALEYYQKALVLTRDTSQTSEQKIALRQYEAYILNKIGEFYYSPENSSRSLEIFNQALSIQDEIEDHQGKIITLIRIGDVYKRLAGCFNGQQSLDYYRQALDVSVENKIFQQEQLRAFLRETWGFDGWDYRVGRPVFIDDDRPTAEVFQQRTGEIIALIKIGDLYRYRTQQCSAVEDFPDSMENSHSIEPI